MSAMGAEYLSRDCRLSAGDDVAVKQLSAYDELRWHKTCGAVCCLRRDGGVRRLSAYDELRWHKTDER